MLTQMVFHEHIIWGLVTILLNNSQTSSLSECLVFLMIAFFNVVWDSFSGMFTKVFATLSIMLCDNSWTTFANMFLL